MGVEQRLFINKIAPGAKAAKKETGLLVAPVIAQACLESGYGKASIDNNVFGVKASKNWTGPTKLVKTTEYYTKAQYDKMKASGATMELIEVTRAGQYKVFIHTYFRAYSSIEESIKDHSKLLMMPRYKPVREAKDYKEACRQLQACRYATDPDYSDLLISIIEKYALYELDREGPKPEPKPMVYKVGSKGDAIKQIQINLCRLGIPCSVDGDFGERTKAAVIELQTKNKIEADGVVGPETMKILERGL